LAEERFSRRRFIRLGAALGAGAAGASLLAACGGGGGNQQAGGGDTGGETTGTAKEAQEATNSASGGTTQVQSGSPIARESDVAQGSALKFTDGQSGQQAVLVHLSSGDFAAYSAICTHQGCTVGYKDGNLACPCHGSVFDPANGGQVVNGPAKQPLPKIPVEVQNGEVYRA
jgi:arsenite oxidase small subunit